MLLHLGQCLFVHPGSCLHVVACQPDESARCPCRLHLQSREDFKQEFHAREVANAAMKREMAADWLPEYRPMSIVPPEQSADTILTRVTRISQATLLKVMM